MYLICILLKTFHVFNFVGHKDHNNFFNLENFQVTTVKNWHLVSEIKIMKCSTVAVLNTISC